MRITKTRLRTIVKNARCKDCGTNSPEAMSIVNDDIMCANCANVRLFG
jgi:formylmethanofuran dehydrogenase subunit E